MSARDESLLRRVHAATVGRLDAMVVKRFQTLVSRDPASGGASARQVVIDAFHRLWYDSGQSTWTTVRFEGTTVLKCPLDLWQYQEILEEVRPDVIVETGTAHGGSALVLASICDRLDRGRVVSIDIEDDARPAHPRVTYVIGSSTDATIVERVTRAIPDGSKVMVILDSDHRRDHVLEELRTWADHVSVGSYLIVEDTNIGGHPVFETFGPGPMEALQAFLSERTDFQVDAHRERFLLTFNPCGYLRRTAASDEAFTMRHRM